MLARRLLQAMLLMWLVVTLVFALVRLAPGDPAAFLVPPTASAEDAARVRTELGLDRPIVVQYAHWAGAVVRGDLGTSFATRRPVREVLLAALPVSLALGATSIVLTFLIGVPLGVVQAVRRGTAVDRALTVLTTAAYAAPSFWIALSLIAVFTYGASVLGLPPWLRLPAFGIRTAGADAAGFAAVRDVVRHAVLPVAVLAAVGAAGIARYARAAALDVLDQEFVRAARARGIRPVRLYARHVLANLLPSLVVLFALSLPGVVAGSVFVESVFAWPGMGRATLAAILARDFPVVLGATMFYAAATILVNLAADLALPLLDPRRVRAGA